ncbi:ComEA family DNA-binding protein [Yonghaparkia sp. Soil809]|uniref:ComEA family DNA-binding protein n=1 Tax=Yonghaparkia sp. Soil809 TaxID=1736417 RepID=UPI0009E92564|nr:ComEA family DNA-binding protein [Yonghaparkia sp. Soil809]
MSGDPEAPDDLGAGPPRRSPRLRAAVGAAIVLALLGVAAAVIGALVVPGGSTSVVGGVPSAAPSSSSSSSSSVDVGVGEGAPRPSEAAVIVHVLGSVREPGIVEVRPGDRVMDAIAEAGGALETADLGGVNLARALVDGEQLYVPATGEVVPGGPAGAAGPGGAAPGGAAGSGGAGPPSAAGGLVDLNAADAATLETLPGVGPALAARIIAWREQNGPFRAVDELLAVSGIGEKTLAGFRDQVTV